MMIEHPRTPAIAQSFEVRTSDATWLGFRTALSEQMARIGRSRSVELLSELGYKQAIDCPVAWRPQMLWRFAMEGRR